MCLIGCPMVSWTPCTGEWERPESCERLCKSALSLTTSIVSILEELAFVLFKLFELLLLCGW